MYGEANDICSVRWQQDRYEYKLVGNASPERLSAFIKALFGKAYDTAAAEEQEGRDKGHATSRWKNTQKSVDAGGSHGGWIPYMLHRCS